MTSYLNRSLHAVVGANQLRTLPPVNIRRTERGYEVSLAVPGVRKEDIHLKVEEGILTVTGQAPTVEAERYLRRSFDFGQFERRFELPKGLDEAAVEAHHTDGVLRVVLPLKKPVHVPVI